jgi:hypothetical protein
MDNIKILVTDNQELTRDRIISILSEHIKIQFGQ